MIWTMDVLRCFLGNPFHNHRCSNVGAGLRYSRLSWWDLNDQHRVRWNGRVSWSKLQLDQKSDSVEPLQQQLLCLVVAGRTIRHEHK